MVSQSHQLREDSLLKSAQQAVRSERSQELEEREKAIKEMAPNKTKRALYLATEKKFIGVARERCFLSKIRAFT